MIYAACSQCSQVQSAQVQLAHASLQWSQAQVLWLHVAQLQSAQVQLAQRSAQEPQVQLAHSS